MKLILISCMVFAFVACGAIYSQEPHDYVHSSAMPAGNIVILDVRTQAEFDAGHMENAVLLPYDQIREKAAGILPSKDQPIQVYCRSGRRSAIAADILRGMGFTDVYDLGGLMP